MRLRANGRNRVRARQSNCVTSPLRRGIRCRCRCGTCWLEVGPSLIRKLMPCSPYPAARKAAEEAAKELGWDQARIDQEVKRYHDYLMQQHRVGEGGLYDGRRAVLGEGN